LNTPEIEPANNMWNEAPEDIAQRPATIAPVWHTAVLVAFIFGVSIAGAYRNPVATGAGKVHRLETYALTGTIELAMVAWIAFGLRLRKIPLRSLFGAISSDARSIALDAGIAIVFWIGSMMALGTVALFWLGVETAITHRPLPVHAGKVLTPDPSQEHAVHAVLRLAPSNGKEIAAWILLCLLVGVAEELIFRGYLQKQFTAWARGAAASGVVFSAITFGAAHGYEGIRSMFLLSLFGVFLSLLALFRKSLRAGIFAHSWHDVFAGLMVSFLHARHFL
jgi:membrane protease YdiL (CAAX protease family)